MSSLADLEPEILAITTALGLTTTKHHGNGASVPALNPDFFKAPLDHLRSLLKDQDQRTAFLAALNMLLAATEPTHLTEGGRKFHPLLRDQNRGQLYLTTAASAAAGQVDQLEIGLAAEVAARRETASPTLCLDLPLFRATSTQISVPLQDSGPPLRLALTVPLGGTGGSVSCSLLFGGGAGGGDIQIEVTRPGSGGSPASTLIYDRPSRKEALGPLLGGLLELLESQLPASSEALRLLPTLLGLTDKIPSLPLSALAQDPAAMRSWLAELRETAGADGRSTLVDWLVAVGSLLGASAPSTLPLALPDESQPLELVLVNAGGGLPGLAVTAGLRTASDSHTPVLVVGIRFDLQSSVADCWLTADVGLLALPLAGHQPATVFDHLDLVIRAPASGGPLLPPTTIAGSTLAIGGLRAGVRYRTQRLSPLLELDQVTMAAQSHPHLDLTDARSLTAAVQAGLASAISTGLTGHADTALSSALLELLGLGSGAGPSLDMALFTTAPSRALADLYRLRRASKEGWGPVASAISTLLGEPSGSPVTGNGSTDDPWLVTLTKFAVPAGALPVLSLALWDAAQAGDTGPKMRLGLRLSAAGAVPTASNLYAQLALVAIDLLPQGGGGFQWLDGLTARLDLACPAPAAGESLALTAGKLTAGLAWRPGSPLGLEAALTQVSISAADQTIALGDLMLSPAPSTPSGPSLGFPISADDLWTVIRLLLGRVASSWGGPGGAALSALLGCGAPGRLGLSAELPALPLPSPGDLQSLLGQPLQAVQAWLAGLLQETSLGSDGIPFLVSLRDPLQAVLTESVPFDSVQPPSPLVAPSGSGSQNDPWTLPLQSDGSPGVELLFWLAPGGPPQGWADPALGLLGRSRSDLDAMPDPDPSADPVDNVSPAIVPGPSEVADAALALSQYLDLPTGSLADRSGEIAGNLTALADALVGTDGVVPRESAQPAGAGWAKGPVVFGAHPDLPRDPGAIAAVAAQLADWTGTLNASACSVFLLAPRSMGSDCWQGLLSSIGATNPELVKLDSPGGDPASSDLSGVGAADYYILDLAEGGNSTLTALAQRLQRVVERVFTVKPQSRVVMVAHSYLGLVAAQCIANQKANGSARASDFLGLITLGTPFTAVDVPGFDHGPQAEGLRLTRRIAAAGLADAPVLDAALNYLSAALDSGGTGAPGGSGMFPAGAFNWAGDALPDVGSVPVFTVAGDTGSDLAAALAELLAAAVAETPAGEGPPSHLGFGVRAELRLPTPVEGEPTVQLTIRMDLGHLPLAAGAALVSDPGLGLVVTARISGPEGWLVGDASSTGGKRVRTAELQGSLDGDKAKLRIWLDDVASGEVGLPGSGLDQPQGPMLLAAVLQGLQAAATKAPGGCCSSFLRMLRDLGLLDATSKQPAAKQDAVAALWNDVGGYLAARLPSLLDRPEGLLGFSVAGALPGAGPWILELDLGRAQTQKPLQLVLEARPWRLSLRTDPQGDGLHIAADGRLTAALTLQLSPLKASLNGSAQLLGLHLDHDPATGTVALEAPWLAGRLPLRPVDPGTARAALAPLVTRFLIDAAATVLLERHFGVGQIGSLSELVMRPVSWLLRPQALGGSAGVPLDPTAVNQLLAALAGAAKLPSSVPAPIELPGGLVVTAAGTDSAGGSSPPQTLLKLKLKQPLALDGTADGLSFQRFEVTLAVDQSRHVTLGGSLSLRVPVPGSWSPVVLNLQMGTDGAEASVDLTGPGGPISLTLFPRVTGLGQLLGGAVTSLLTDALNGLVSGLPDTSSGKRIGLEAARALDLYVDGAGFAADQLGKLVDDLSHGDPRLTPSVIATSLSTLLAKLLPSPAATITTTSTGLRAALPLPPTVGRSSSAEMSLDLSPPTLRLTMTGLELGSSTRPYVQASLNVGAAWPGGAGGAVQLTAEANFALQVDTGLGLILQPGLTVRLNAGQLQVSLQPMPGDKSAVISLAPTPGLSPGLTQTLIDNWGAPLAAELLITAAGAWMDRPMWTATSGSSAPLSARAALKGAGILTADGRLAMPAAGVAWLQSGNLLSAALRAFTGLSIPLTKSLWLGFQVPAPGPAGDYGILLSGSADLPVSAYALGLAFGLPTQPAELATTLKELKWASPTGIGFTALHSDGRAFSFQPSLQLRGLGLRLRASADGAKLIDTSAFQLGHVGAYLTADLSLPAAGPSVDNLHGAVAMEQIGLPFLNPTTLTDQNPLVSSLLSSGSGDQTAASPPVDLIVGSTTDSQLVVLINGLADGSVPHWFPVHRQLGPLYLDQVGIHHPALQPRVEVMVDGSVSLAGLGVGLKGLAIGVPLANPLRPGGPDWTVGLDGLAVEFASAAATIEGSLVKSGTGATAEYDGSLVARVAGRGLAAIGAFSQPADGQGNFLSLFAYVSITTPLGGPPYFYVLGLAGGAGYNRRLIVPTDPLIVSGFPLVSSLSGGLGSGGSPATVQQALAPLSNALPPTRGSYWLAAGVHFSTFQLLDTTALAYLALDRGIQIGVLGISRLVLPQPGQTSDVKPIVNAELALNALFDSAQRILSLRAQLTDHSWLISPDCQLTGGFALVVWFAKHRFVLTLGGYAPAPGFTPAADLPVVPRVGFHWAVSDTVTVKGETYFALLPSCVMFGGRLEATYKSGAVELWFVAWLDVLVGWDPFHYQADVGVSIGARFKQRVCVIWCVEIDVQVSLGVNLTLAGPPLHGHVHVDLAVISLDAEFGDTPPPLTQTLQQWPDFVARYLPPPSGAQVDWSVAQAVSVQVVNGAAPRSDFSVGLHPVGPPPVLPAFSVRTESRLPIFAPAGTPAVTLSVQTAAGALSPVAVDLAATQSATKGPLSVVPLGGGAGSITQVVHAVKISPDSKTTARPSGITAATWSSGFATALWLRAPTKPSEVEASGGSLEAVGGIEITFAPMLGARGPTLAFGGASGGSIDVPPEAPVLPFVAPKLNSTPARPAAPTRLANPGTNVASPRLSATLSHNALAAHSTFGWDSTEVSPLSRSLFPGNSTVWDLEAGSPAPVVRVGSGAASRVTCLTGGGCPLVDRVVAGDGKLYRLPAGTIRLVAAPVADPPDAAAGWEASSRLLQVGPSTLLGHQCVVLPGSPVPSSPTRPLQMGSAPAHMLVNHVHTLTLLPREVEAVIVIVDADRSGAEDANAAPRVRLDGVLCTPVEPSADGPWPGTSCWVYQPGAKTEAPQLEVSVDTSGLGNLAGVIGLRGPLSAQVGELLAFPGRRLLADPPPVAATSADLHLLPVPNLDGSSISWEAL